MNYSCIDSVSLPNMIFELRLIAKCSFSGKKLHNKFKFNEDDGHRHSLCNRILAQLDVMLLNVFVLHIFSHPEQLLAARMRISVL